MWRILLIMVGFLVGVIPAVPSSAEPAPKTVRIAAFNLYPGIFKAKDGSIRGFFPDLIEEVARREGWRLEYRYGDWVDGLSRARKGEVDVLTSVAWTRDRAEFLDYARTPLLTVWGELYVPRNSRLESIKALEGKTVAVMKGDFNGASFRKMAQQLGIGCRFEEYGGFTEVFIAVSSGEADAGVANNTFGAAMQYRYRLVSSGILFNPFDIFFAVPKGTNAEVLETLDRYLAEWRSKADSPYQQALRRWGHPETASEAVPSWLLPAAAGGALLCVAAAVFIILLRLQVRRKTAAIVAQAEDRQKIEETLFYINDCGSLCRGDDLLAGINRYLCSCLEADYAFVAQFLPEPGQARTRGLYGKSGKLDDVAFPLSGTPCEQVVGRTPCVHRHGVSRLFPDDPMLADLGVEGYAAVPIRTSQGTSIGVLGILTRRPLGDTHLLETVLGIAGSRVAQELEAMSHLETLKLKNFTIDNIKDAVYWIAPDGRIWDVNGAAVAMLGYGREEFLTMSISDLGPDFPIERWLSHWKELKQKGNLQFEASHRAKDGRVIPLEITANYCSYNGTEFKCAIVRDISERKRMEEALEHRLAVLTEPVAELSQIRIEDLFDLEELQVIQDSFAQATGVASLITDPKGRPITAPSNFCVLCRDIIRKSERGLANCTRSDAMLVNGDRSGPCLQPCLSGGLWDGGAAIHVGGHYLGNWLVGQVLDEECDTETMMAYAREIGADEDAYREALAQVTRMPREQFEKVCRALYQIAGQLSRMAIHNVQQAQHISERKRAEELLLEYRKVIECSQDMICVVDREYRYRMANRAFLTFVDRGMEEVVGRGAEEVLGSETFAEVKPYIDASLAGIPVHFVMGEDAGKAARSLSVGCSPIHDKSGGTRVACVISDQTEKKHLEEQLRQSQKMEAIGHLAGGIAHDFNNILTVIVGYGNFLGLDPGLTPQQKEQVEQIIAASEKGAQLTRGLLTFSRKQVLHPRIIELNSVVSRVQNFLLRIIGEDIRLRFNPHGRDLNVLADSSQLEQILMNLVTNARDAMPGGGTVTIETCEQEISEAYARSQGYGSPGNYACLIVSDTGVGMDRETCERIFEPFFTTKGVGKGTGLGMSIVYGIVKQHKGFINVYSEAGEGTTFKIYLPLTQPEAAETKELQRQDAPPTGSETVLVAEDDESVRRLVQSLLVKHGYTVILAVDGRDCVEKYRENMGRIALILMDVIMPGKSGREAFEEIKGIDPAARVLYTSGYTADFMQNRGVFDEPVDLVMKPVQPTELLKKMREVLDRK